MARYASGGYIPAPPQGDDRVLAFLSAGCTIPYPTGQPVHLDDDECVVHQDQGGWHCVRVLHVGQPCRTPPSTTPAQDRREPHATVDVQPTATAASRPLTPTALAQPDLPTLDTHPTLGSGTHPTHRAEGRQDTGDSQADAARPDTTR